MPGAIANDQKAPRTPIAHVVASVVDHCHHGSAYRLGPAEHLGCSKLNQRDRR
jgi:hypothetical protein